MTENGVKTFKRAYKFAGFVERRFTQRAMEFSRHRKKKCTQLPGPVPKHWWSRRVSLPGMFPHSGLLRVEHNYKRINAPYGSVDSGVEFDALPAVTTGTILVLTVMELCGSVDPSTSFVSDKRSIVFRGINGHRYVGDCSKSIHRKVGAACSIQTRIFRKAHEKHFS